MYFTSFSVLYMRDTNDKNEKHSFYLFYFYKYTKNRQIESKNKRIGEWMY